jgi:hypothetical protein
VLGPENWYDEYVPLEHSVICKLTIRLPNGVWLTKCDAGGYAGMSDSGDDDKSGFSDSFKRAAVKFGVARYLYRDGVPNFARPMSSTVVAPPGAYRKDVPPEARHLPVPEDAPLNPKSLTDAPTIYPDGTVGEPIPAIPSEAEPEPPPRHGRGLFAWCADQQDAHQVKFLHKVTDAFREEGMPSRLMDWTAEQVKDRWPAILRIRDEAIAAKGGNGRHLPEPEGAPPPGGSAPASPPWDKVTNDPLKSARQALYRRLHRIARVQQGTDTPTVDNLRLVLSGLHVVCPDMPRIDSLNACDDVGLLSAYAVAADAQLRRLEPDVEEAPY